jgi:hypothetical protein
MEKSMSNQTEDCHEDRLEEIINDIDDAITNGGRLLSQIEGILMELPHAKNSEIKKTIRDAIGYMSIVMDKLADSLGQLE